MSLRPLLLVGLLLLIVAIPLQQGSWGEELPWVTIVSALAGPAAIYYLYWHYWRDTENPDPTRRARRRTVLIGSPLAAVAGVLIAGAASAVTLAAAFVLGLAFGSAFWFLAA